MRKTTALVITIVIILIAAVGAYVISTQLQSRTSSTQTSTGPALKQNLAGAANYLVVNYNPTLGLIPETPGSNVYWLYSDNFLASLALSQYGESNTTIAKFASDLSVSLSNYLPLGSTVNQYTTLELGTCEYDSAINDTVLVTGSARIETVDNNGSGTLSETQYADIAFLDAVCQYHNGNTQAAMAAYQEGAKMFNGIGLVDLPFNKTQQYQTYKLALFIFASVVLGQPVNNAALSTLLMMQAPDGGFYTGYNASYSHGTTLTNTETTSLALLAVESVNQDSS